MKRRRIKTWVKVLLFIIFIIIIEYSLKPGDDKVINKCSKEHNLNYCYKIVYGY